MTTRQGIVAANWKMHGSLQEVTTFAQQLTAVKTTQTVVFSPPSVYLQAAVTAIQSSDNVFIAAQTGHEALSGAFTGEIAMPMLHNVGCQYVIIGHSERRTLFGETDNVVFNKVKQAFEQGLIPILCIGETDAQNQAGETEAVLDRQLKAAREQLTAEHKQALVIAYEPVWAIGTGRTPSIEDIQAIHEKIRYLFSQNDDTISACLRILYGGSVKSDNAQAIFACPDVDGGLVGGASLTIASFEQIITAL